MNKIISYKQFLVEKLNEADTFIPSTNKEGISKATKDTKNQILQSMNMILQDKGMWGHLLDAFVDQVVNPLTAAPNLVTKPLGADLNIDTNLKTFKLTDLSEEAQKGLVAVLLLNAQQPIQPIFDFLNSSNLQIPINFKDLQAITTQFDANVSSYISVIQKDVESNPFNTEFPSMFSISEYLNLNLDRSSVGVANSINLLMTYMQGKLPAKTNWGSIEGYVYAVLLMSTLTGLFMVWGKDILGLGDKLYKNGGKKLGDEVYNTFGTLIPGLRDSIKKLGDEISKLAETPLGLALIGITTIYRVGNQIQKIIDENDKMKFQKIGVNSFIPVFKSLPVYNSIIEKTRVNVNTYLKDLQENEGRINSLRQLIEQKGKEQVVEMFKNKFKESFTPLLTKSFNEKLEMVKGSLGEYPVINEGATIDYKTISDAVVRSSAKLADSWTGVSWFNRYKDPNDAIQEIVLLIEQEIELDGFTNKEDPFIMLVGSLVYLSLIDVCISLPELVIVQGVVNVNIPPKLVIPYKVMNVPEFKVPSLPLNLTRIEDSMDLEESGDICGVYISMVNKKGELIKTKFADITFGTGKSTIKKPENFSARFLALLKSYYGVKLIVTGNADVTGIEGKEKGERGNVPLSGRRAQSLMGLLKDMNGVGEFIDIVKDVKIYGKGAEYSRAYPEYIDKGMRTGKLVSKLAGKDKTKETEIRKELANDRRVEIYLSFNDKDYQSKVADQAFIKEYCVMKPNMPEGNLFAWVDKKTKIVIKNEMVSNFAVTVRPADGSIPVVPDTKDKIKPVDTTPEKTVGESMNLYGYNDFLFERVMRDKLKRRW